MEKSIRETASRLLVFGGSAGSLEVIIKVLPRLSLKKDMGIIIVLHRKSSDGSLLADVLNVRSNMIVREADDKDTIEAGRIYLAPGDYHLLVEANKCLSLDASEKVNFSRPSIDVTFETAAEAYGENCTCVLLSGASADGAQGLKFAKEQGARTWVQNPDTADVSYMPQSALQLFTPDKMLTPEEMVKAINEL
jgi:two-component system, chemotaxis family, protein-glutamate methylesterase/glutaminase